MLYLLPKLPQLLAPPAVVYLLAYVARSRFAYGVPPWALALACVLSWPAAFTIAVQWYNFKVARGAAARGARLPPVVKAKYPGSVDLMMLNNRDVEERFLGERVSGGASWFRANRNGPGYRMSEWTKEYGWTYNFRLLFQNRVRIDVNRASQFPMLTEIRFSRRNLNISRFVRS